MKIATIAALAFGTLASAVPSPAPVAETRDLVERQSTDLTTILTNLNNDLQGPVGQLNGLTSSTATPTVVANICADIQVIVVAAVNACNGLPAGALGSGDILVLLSVVLELILNACNYVYKLSGVDVVDIQIAIKVQLDVCLAALINVVIELLGGIVVTLVAQLVVLLGVVVNIVLELNLTACISALLLV